MSVLFASCSLLAVSHQLSSLLPAPCRTRRRSHSSIDLLLSLTLFSFTLSSRSRRPLHSTPPDAFLPPPLRTSPLQLFDCLTDENRLREGPKREEITVSPTELHTSEHRGGQYDGNNRRQRRGKTKQTSKRRRRGMKMERESDSDDSQTVANRLK